MLNKTFKKAALGVSIAIATHTAVATELSDVTLFTAQEIITMNNDQPTAQAVAVHEGEIIAVGETDALLKQYGETEGFTLNTDFEEQVLTPGFVEPHLHAWLLGILTPLEFITPADWTLPWGDVKGVQSEDAFIARIKELDAELAEGEPLWIWGYHQYFHGGNINKSLLNEISSDRPIVVWHRSFHEMFFNDQALAMFGWTEADWQGEAYGYNHLDWEAGHAFEQGGPIILPTVIGTMAQQGLIHKGFERTKQYMQSAGVTTAIDPGISVDDDTIKLMVSIFESGDFGMDYWMMPSAFMLNAFAGGDNDKILAMHKAQVTNPSTQGEQVKWMPNHVKLFADGAMYSQLMQMKDGYTDGHDGEWMMYPDQLESIWGAYWQEGYTAVIHANGDLGFDTAVGILEKLNKAHPRDDHRTDFHHLGFTDKDDIPRAVEAGASFSVNPFYTHVLGENYSQFGIGPERASEMSRGRSFLDAGGRLSLHSDAPMAPASPLMMMWASVNRTGLSGKVLGPQERITAQEALRAVTLDSAYTARLDNEVGSIEVGKLANFAVLEASPYTVKPENIKDIGVKATVYKGHTFVSESGRSAGIAMDDENFMIAQLLNRMDVALGRGVDSCQFSTEIQRAFSTLAL
ncbi:amidohydrolase [Thaumasiovibrio subtropicus]|uniref:amidohydrolase n=1 Tax=Thaumasiovibrio subtropicus TaxID=1891207 RepID=UPI000B357334|nr:amidohydrolase [Thaumasiovibrio subtropicus]